MNNIVEQPLRALIVEKLHPLVSDVDLNGRYPRDFLRELGLAGHYSSRETGPANRAHRNLWLIEEVAGACNSTAFALWCHLTGLTYVQEGESNYLKETLLNKLESGQVLCGTGLSNAMKFYAGLESLKLHAQRVAGGYQFSGILPYISNLANDHWFGCVAEVDKQQRVAAFIPCDLPGLTLSERQGFMGLNGTATYHCRFVQAFVPDHYVINHDADALVKRVQPGFILTQVGMGLGLSESIIKGIERLSKKTGHSNHYLPQQAEPLRERLQTIRIQAYRAAEFNNADGSSVREIMAIRLDSAYLALDAAQAAMLHIGGAAYLRQSAASRRLREAYFVALVTPTVKHLEKLLRAPESCLL